jgi:hypothetical protein
VDVAIIVAVFAGLTVVLAGGTFLVARLAARRTSNVQAEWAERERRDPSVCGACFGERILYEPRAVGRTGVTAQFVDCWRCGGTGRPADHLLNGQLAASSSPATPPWLRRRGQRRR